MQKQKAEFQAQACTSSTLPISAMQWMGVEGAEMVSVLPFRQFEQGEGLPNLAVTLLADISKIIAHTKILASDNFNLLYIIVVSLSHLPGTWHWAWVEWLLLWGVLVPGTSCGFSSYYVQTKDMLDIRWSLNTKWN